MAASYQPRGIGDLVAVARSRLLRVSTCTGVSWSALGLGAEAIDLAGVLDYWVLGFGVLAVPLTGALDRMPGYFFFWGGAAPLTLVAERVPGTFGGIERAASVLYVPPPASKPVYVPPRALTCLLNPNVPHQQFPARNVVLLAKKNHRSDRQIS